MSQVQKRKQETSPVSEKKPKFEIVFKCGKCNFPMKQQSFECCEHCDASDLCSDCRAKCDYCSGEFCNKCVDKKIHECSFNDNELIEESAEESSSEEESEEIEEGRNKKRKMKTDKEEDEEEEEEEDDVDDDVDEEEEEEEEETDDEEEQEKNSDEE